MNLEEKPKTINAIKQKEENLGLLASKFKTLSVAIHEQKKSR